MAYRQKLVNEEQNGQDRAKYGSFLIEELSAKLTKEFGRGFSKQSPWNMRQFYNTFPILSTLCRELSWSHYRLLLRLESETARHSGIWKSALSQTGVLGR